MRRRYNAKLIRNNALERYLNESSFCYANIGSAQDDLTFFAPTSIIASSAKYPPEIKDENEEETIGTKNIPTSLSLQKSSVPHSDKTIAFVSQNANIGKNKPFLRGYKRLPHRDKEAINVFSFYRFA